MGFATGRVECAGCRVASAGPPAPGGPGAAEVVYNCIQGLDGVRPSSQGTRGKGGTVGPLPALPGLPVQIDPNRCQKILSIAATFPHLPGFRDRKTFLKVLLIIALAIVAGKLLPLTLVVGGLLAAGVALLAVIGVSMLAIGTCLGLGLIALLSPLWLPVLALIGIVMLVKRHNRSVA